MNAPTPEEWVVAAGRQVWADHFSDLRNEADKAIAAPRPQPSGTSLERSSFAKRIHFLLHVE